MMDNNIKRFWEIDFLRGVAIIMMIIFHFIYDINYFEILKIDIQSGYISIFNYSIGTIFLLLVGISLTLSYSRSKKKLSKRKLTFKFLKRGAKIFTLGLLITAVTWLFLDQGFIIFGVLHCIGTSIIISYFFINYRYSNIILGGSLILIGLILRNYTFDFYWLMWLGFKFPRLYTIDYFPLLPWLGVILIGIFLGNKLYPNYKRAIKIKNLDRYKSIRFFSYLGRHSLIIYFLHQIILLSLIYLIFLK
jgi:uncharacterized membrane protein